MFLSCSQPCNEQLLLQECIHGLYPKACATGYSTVAPFVFCKGLFKGYLIPRFSPSSSFNSVSISIYWWSICISGCLTGCERNAPLHSLASPLTNIAFCYESKSWFSLKRFLGCIASCDACHCLLVAQPQHRV